MVSDSDIKIICRDVDESIKEAQVQFNKAQKLQTLYYNMKLRELDIKDGEFLLVQKHWFSSRRQERVASLDRNL